MVRNLVIGIAAVGLIGMSGTGLAADGRVTADTGVGVKAPGVSVTGTANAKARVSTTPRKPRAETSEPGERGSGINGRLNTRIPMRPTIHDKVHDAPDFRA